MLTKEEQIEIAETIRRQYGANRFSTMTGAKCFIAQDCGLSFKLPSRFAKHGINYVKVTLTPADTYDVEYGKIWGTKYKTVCTTSGIYADMLQADFTRKTGLDTHL